MSGNMNWRGDGAEATIKTDRYDGPLGVVLDWLENQIDGFEENRGHDETISAHIRAIEDAQDYIKRNRWISVTDRLPKRTIELPELKMPNGQVMGPQKNSANVLVLTRGNEEPTIDHLIEGADGELVWYLNAGSTVTHWRLLPLGWRDTK